MDDIIAILWYYNIIDSRKAHFITRKLHVYSTQTGTIAIIKDMHMIVHSNPGELRLDMYYT